MRFTQLLTAFSTASLVVAAPFVEIESRSQVTQCSQSTSLHCCTASGKSSSTGGLVGSVLGGFLSITCTPIAIVGGAVSAVCVGGNNACCGQDKPEQTATCGQYQFLSNDLNGNDLLYCNAI